jgi:putative DNA primase/helicase
MSLDNISKLPVWLSDALCRLATGGALATQELYTDDSEKIFDSKRPIILKGIDELAERDDLADRALVVSLARIPENKRRSQRELLAELEKAGPGILAALLRVLSNALAGLDSVRLSPLPRMADFALLITAAEPGLGWPEGLFMRVYMENRADAAAGWVESDSVGVTVLGFMKAREHWKGTLRNCWRS